MAIESGSVEVVYPGGFYFTSADPMPDQAQNHWDINNIPSGAEGTITITGQMVGQKGDSKDITALFTYKPANFNSDFQTSASHTVTLGDSILKLDVTLPERVRTGEEVKYVYTLTNTATLPLVNVKGYVQYPEGYNVKSAEPAAQQSNHTWIFDQIDPGKTETVTITGEVTGENESTQELVLQVGLQEPDGFFNLQTEDRHSMYVINPEMSLTLTGPASTQAGGELEYTIALENTSTIDISDIALQLAFTSGVVSSETVELDQIAELAAGESKQVTYTTTVLDEVLSSVNTLTATLTVLSAKVSNADVTFDQTATVETALQGSILGSAEARYFSDDLTKLGSGPLPPTVEKATEYVIQWTVSAAGSAMSGVNFATTLPDGVEFVRSSDERIQYDDTQRSVMWDIKNLTAGETKTTSYKISVTPQTSDVNKLLVLQNETIITAVDGNSNATVQSQINKVTSKLESDPGTTDDGVVVSE
ncbi:MAG: hypothetical protein ACD_43C00169G0001 [uncultured bacterium]|nr:MAG: hypothetical protein ACD_43C00169G0001 [uncultured bacterium]